MSPDHFTDMPERRQSLPNPALKESLTATEADRLYFYLAKTYRITPQIQDLAGKTPEAIENMFLENFPRITMSIMTLLLVIGREKT